MRIRLKLNKDITPSFAQNSPIKKYNRKKDNLVALEFCNLIKFNALIFVI